MNRILSTGPWLAALLVASACQRAGTPAAAPRDPPVASDPTAPVAASGAAAATIAYHCDGLDFVVRYDSDHVTLQTADHRYVLPQVRAADGAKFHSDDATFWSKGEEAVVEIKGEPYTNCRERLASEAPPAPY